MIDDNSPVWIWDRDSDLLDRTGVAIQIDYNRSTIGTTAFWDAVAPIMSDGRLVFSATANAEKELSSYSFYPPNPHLPVVNSELRSAIELVCDADEVAFHPCEIRMRSGKVIYAWNLYPLKQIACIDREASDVNWKVSEKHPEGSTIKDALYVRFRQNCLGNLNIARLKEDVFWILVSNRVKEAIEGVNSKGILFRRDKDSRIGKLF